MVAPITDSNICSNLSVCIAPTSEEHDELLRCVTPVHIEGEKTAVLSTDVTGQALQMSLVISSGGVVVSYERLYRGHHWDDAVSIKEVCTR